VLVVTRAPRWAQTLNEFARRWGAAAAKLAQLQHAAAQARAGPTPIAMPPAPPCDAGVITAITAITAAVR
jgi:hypothetical protein